ncbi:MAG: response regulator, partial [Rhizobium leguminosarum]|nr:response regulator [Rhizobium leguminosarum]
MVDASKTSLVICVEDDEPVRDALRGLLRANGMWVAAFASAEEFLASTELQTAACLVTDIQLGGISGLDLLDKLSGMNRRIPSIL